MEPGAPITGAVGATSAAKRLAWPEHANVQWCEARKSAQLKTRGARTLVPHLGRWSQSSPEAVDPDRPVIRRAGDSSDLPSQRR